MANFGNDLIAAMLANGTLTAINRCPAVSVEVGRAMYGKVQNDSGPGHVIRQGDEMQKEIAKVVGFSGANSETAVWHFMTDGPLHHFVVIPWYKHDFPHGRVYTVLMAYENMYTLNEYASRTGRALSPGGNGYQLTWTATELSTMLSDLLNLGAAWENYFGRVGAAHATKVTCWKYGVIDIKTAIEKVRRY